MRAKLLALRNGLFFWRDDSLSRAILASIFTVGALTAAVKAVAFGKELLVANYFGTADAMDAFTTAFVMWTFLIGVVGGAIPDSLIPVYSKLRMKGERAGDDLVITSVWIYVIQLVALTGLMFFAGQWLVPFFTMNYSEEKRAMALEFFRQLAPFSIFWGTSLLFTMLLHANKRFVLAALAPAFVPGITMIFLLLGFRSFGIYAMIVGTVAGALIQVVILHVAFFRNHCTANLWKPQKWWNEDVRLVIKTSIPYWFGGIVMGSAVLIDVGMAALLDEGSVSVLSYGVRVCAIGLTLASTATSEAFFPYLADMVAANQWRKLRQTVLKFTALILVGCIPVIAIIWMGSEQIVALLFQRGEFTAEDTVRVADVLRWLSLQIPFYITAVLGSRVICAMLESRFIMVASFFNLGANILFNYIAIKHLHMGVAGIALSTALVYFLSALMIYAYFLWKVRHRADAPESPTPVS